MVTTKRKGSKQTSRRSVATTKEEKSAVEGSVTKTITTETVTRRHSVAGPINETIYEYVEDDWERSPKTDYTYARSCTYLKAQSAKVISPNMSRRRLHGGTPLMSPIPKLRLQDSPDSDASDLTSVSQQRQSQESMPSQIESTPVSRRARRRATPADSGSESESGNIRRSGYPASCTRSGTQYGLKQYWARKRREAMMGGGQSTLITDDIDSSQTQTSGSRHRLDYSVESEQGDTTTDRESYSPVPHLYGLDHYSDESDTETTTTWRSSYYSKPPSVTTRQKITSYFTSIWTSILIVITTICRTSWQLITYPVSSVVHLITRRQHQVTRSQSYPESHSVTTDSLTWWQKIIKACTSILYYIFLAPPIAVGNCMKSVSVGFCQWAHHRYEGFKEYHEYESDKGYETIETTVVTQETGSADKNVNNADETEKSDIEKEYDDTEEDSEINCCMDMIQTLINVVFFLVVGFPILVGGYLIDTLSGNREGYGREVVEDEEDAEAEEKQAEEEQNQNDTSEESSLIWRIFTCPLWMVYWLLFPTPRAVGQFALDKCSNVYHGIADKAALSDKAFGSVTTVTTSTTVINSGNGDSSEFTEESTVSEQHSNISMHVFRRYLVNPVLDSMVGDSVSDDYRRVRRDSTDSETETEVHETVEYVEEYDGIDSWLWTIITLPIWLLHSLLVSAPVAVGKIAWEVLAVWFGSIIPTRSAQLEDGATEDIEETNESVSTSTTTTTEIKTTELDDSTDGSHSLLWTILTSPFLLTEWILFTLPTAVGRWILSSLRWVIGYRDAPQIKKTKSVHFADESEDPNLTVINEETAGGLDTVDASAQDAEDESSIEEPETDSRLTRILWMLVAFPVFILYWTVIGLPLALGRYIIGRLSALRLFLFGSSDTKHHETDDQETTTSERSTTTSTSTSTSTSETLTNVTETSETYVEPLYLTVVLLPFRLVKWLSVLLLLIPIEIGKWIHKGASRIWASIAAIFTSIGGSNAETNENINSSETVIGQSTKKTKVTQAESVAQSGESVITRISRTLKSVVSSIWKSIYWVLFVIPFGLSWTIVEWISRLWKRFTSLFVSSKAIDQDKDVDETEVQRWSISRSVSKTASVIVYPVVYTGNLIRRAWMSIFQSAYKGFASVILIDSWLLSKTSAPRRRSGLCSLLPLILLIPLLLVGLLYIFGCGSGGLLGIIPIPVFSNPLARSPVAVAPSGGCTSCPPPITDEQLAEKVQHIFAGLYKDKEAETTEKQANDQAAIVLQQTTLLDNHMQNVDGMVKSMVEKELNSFKAEVAASTATKAAVENGNFDEALVLQQQAFNLKLGQMEGQHKTDLLAVQNEVKAVNDNVQGVIAALAAAREDLKLDDEKVRGEGAALVAGLEAKLAGLNDDLSKLETTQIGLMAGVKDCCKNDSVLALLVKAAVQEHMVALMAENQEGGNTIIGGAASTSGSDAPEEKEETQFDSTPFMTFLNSHNYAKQDDIDERIAVLTARLNEQIKSQSETAAAAAIAAAALSQSTKEETTSAGMAAAPVVDCSTCKGLFMLGNGTQLTESQVKLLIKEALLIFGADKTGMVDYALESSGGSILSTRCSETYHRRTAQISLFGIPLWYASNSPRTVIQPEVQPGQCWAFKGTEGYLVIQLAGAVQPTAFSLEHIPKGLSPTGKIDSAPKDFSVWGLEHEKDAEAVPLGNYTYYDNGEPLQFFPVTDPNVPGFNIVELRIHSNHGNLEYTCLYRFRVHGNLKRW